MALFRYLRLSSWVRSTAMDWDPRVQRWRVEVRFEHQRVLWSWPRTADGAAEQRTLAEGKRRPR